ncbi:MAG: biotin--[acetyl-CoA-carboxylase] ligase, partial [Chloroflexota bacterium]
MANDVISPPLITRGLPTRFIGQRVLYYPRLTSTMDIARREARQKAPEGTVVIADEQTAGRGRIQRVWLSPKGSVSLSVLLYPSLTSLPYLVMLASLAVAHSIEALTGLKPQIKWPNDVLINRKKVCGILVESEVRGDKLNYAIIGIGINVCLDPTGIPEIRSTATSVAAEAGRDISRLELVRELLRQLDNLYTSSPDGEATF